jgi:hypothetical protein
MNEIAKVNSAKSSVLETVKNKIMQYTSMTEQQWKDHKIAVTASLFKLRTAFPTQSSKHSELEAEMLTALWLEVFAEINPEMLETAVNLYIKSDRKGFFPSPGQVMGIVEDIIDSMPPKGFVITGETKQGFIGYYSEDKNDE